MPTDECGRLDQTLSAVDRTHSVTGAANGLKYVHFYKSRMRDLLVANPQCRQHLMVRTALCSSSMTMSVIEINLRTWVTRDSFEIPPESGQRAQRSLANVFSCTYKRDLLSDISEVAHQSIPETTQNAVGSFVVASQDQRESSVYVSMECPVVQPAMK